MAIPDPSVPPVDTQLLLICFLAFVIHLIGTLAYSVRIAGVCMRRIVVSLALFSILMLVWRTSNSFAGPFLAKRVETACTGWPPERHWQAGWQRRLCCCQRRR